MAASYAHNHGEQLTGVILFATYPTKKLDDHLTEVNLYGSEDGVLNMDKIAAGKAYAPEAFFERVIEGGNHAQFGNYGKQKGDGAAVISAQNQQGQAVQFILDSVMAGMNF